MKFFLVVALAALGAVLAEDAERFEPIFKDYHEEIGIPTATRIKQAEEQQTAESRIVGGSFANNGQFPYQIGLLITLVDGRTSACGASMLSNTVHLTAAHCNAHGNAVARSFLLVFGSTSLYSGGVRVTTTNVEPHANYNQNTLNNDLAILKTSWVSYTNAIQPISLPSGSLLNNNLAGSWVTASGFGRFSDSSSNNNPAMRHVNLQVITNNACASIYGSATVISSVICTSGDGGRGTCSGDSGGPVAFQSNGPVLAGVVSFGSSRGCQVGYPAGHSRVSSFVNWITARM